MSGMLKEQAKEAYKDKFGSHPPDDLLRESLPFFVDHAGGTQKPQNVVALLIRFAEKMKDETETETETALAVPQGKQGRAKAEETIKLDALYQQLEPWVLHWRKTIFEQKQPPFETVKAAFEWIEDVAGNNGYLDDKRAEQCREKGLSWMAIMQDDDLPDVFPAVVAGHDLQVDNAELKRVPTEADQKLLDQLREREVKARKEQEDYYREIDEQDGSEPPDWSPLKPASHYFRRLQSEAESIAPPTDFTEVGIILSVLTPHKPSGTRCRIKKHRESLASGSVGALNKFGSYTREWVTLELLSQTITEDDVRDMARKAKKHLGNHGKKYFKEDMLELWNTTKDLGGIQRDKDEWEPPEQFDTKNAFYDAIAEELPKYQRESTEKTRNNLRMKMDRLVERLYRRYFSNLAKSEADTKNLTEGTT